MARVRPYSLFRKASFSLWGQPADPSVYGFTVWDVTDVPKKMRNAILIKALGYVIERNPHLNSQLRFGRLTPRDSIDVSIMMKKSVEDGHDLTFTTIKQVDKLTVEKIHEVINSKKVTIYEKHQDEVGIALQLIHLMPKFLGRVFLKLYGWLAFDFGFNLSFLKLPHKPFGSVIISNIGSLGLKKGLLPLVPFTRSCLMVAMGRAEFEPAYYNQQIVARETIHLGVTFDHRYFDGAEAAKMLRDFEDFLKLNLEAPSSI